MNRTTITVLTVLIAAGSAAAQNWSGGMVVFGDSLSDTGNIYTMTGLLSTKRPNTPWYTVKRWTCGADNTVMPQTQTAMAHGSIVWHERLADILNIPRATPSRPSTDPGYNYAHGGATSGTGADQYNITHNLQRQVGDFLTRQGSGAIPTDRLYVMWAGGNDIRDSARVGLDTQFVLDWSARQAVANIKGQIELLSQHVPSNQRITVLWPNLPPMQGVPDIRSLGDEVAGWVGDACETFRTQQLDAVTALAGTAPNVDIKVLNVHGLWSDMIAGQLGWTPLDTTRNIINAGDFSAQWFTPTRNAAVPVGANPDQYVFWDEVHPTSRVHRLIGEIAYGVVPSPGAGMLLGLGLLTAARRARRA
ncbi:MAG: hypothetical protein HBSAPP03_02030 [Phycisphaerae bacterium]|nr:MAG: hypothetical protein HBSAPP03_02030 [Phycisphaerae bacterium]